MILHIIEYLIYYYINYLNSIIIHIKTKIAVIFYHHLSHRIDILIYSMHRVGLCFHSINISTSNNFIFNSFINPPHASNLFGGYVTNKL